MFHKMQARSGQMPAGCEHSGAVSIFFLRLSRLKHARRPGVLDYFGQLVISAWMVGITGSIPGGNLLHARSSEG